MPDSLIGLGLLSTREIQVFRQLVGSALSYKQIANKLKMSEKTMGSHTHNIYQKLEVHSRQELVLWAHRNGVDK